MSESWRRKSYYDPRVVIRTSFVLDPPFPDALVCLTGPQLAMLRNVTQYLHRRSTFASEYHEGYYLAPTNEEWDQLAAIVSDLEDKLMTCEDFMQVLQDIKAAAECACEKLTDLPRTGWPTGGIHEDQPDYDDYQSPVEREVGDPPGELATWDDWDDYKCIAAQIVVDDATSLTGKLANLYSAGAIITFEAFQILILGTSLTPPVALVLLVVEALLVAGTLITVQAVEDWISTHALDIVCAIQGATSQGVARLALEDLLDAEWDLVMGKPFFWGVFSQKQLAHIFDATLPKYAEKSSSYDTAYCDTCESGPPSTWWEQNAPPCPGGVVFQSGWTCNVDEQWACKKQYGGSTYAIWPTRVVPAGTWDLHIELDAYTFTSGGWTVGYARFQTSPDLSVWTTRKTCQIIVGATQEWRTLEYDAEDVVFASNLYCRMTIQQQEYQNYWKYYKRLRWELAAPE